MESRPPTDGVGLRDVPELDVGLTHLHTETTQSPGLLHLVVSNLDHSTTAYWVDARNTANTYRLYEAASDNQQLSGLQIARAFTAYQHFELCRQLCRSVTPETGLVCLPNIESLYRDDDVPDHERDHLFESVLDGLTALAETLDVRLLVSTAVDDALRESVQARADRTLTCETTPFGCSFDGEGVETTVYPVRGGWQTTIPYWVELLGVADDRALVEAAYETEFAGVA